jgi:hypothetical protein
MAAQAIPLDRTETSAKSAPQPFLGDTARIVIVSLGLILALQVGGVIADAIRADTPWLTMLCYTGPVAAASVAFWLIGRLIKA